MHGLGVVFFLGKGTDNLFSVASLFDNVAPALEGPVVGEDVAACETGVLYCRAWSPYCTREVVFAAAVKDTKLLITELASEEINLPFSSWADESSHGPAVRESSDNCSSNAPPATAFVNHSKMKSLLALKAVTVMPISSSSFRIVRQTSLSFKQRESVV